ncbi:hypothetical protein GYMLUDRAFT_49611 [Collybiopsis luxurians FD-317 M1]|uniref:Uncharacterized protein n=1 Tax=Collybiopsis luxurians FD-317 M1 TaxID=944289 RepID=A0A0D0BTY1_9AGAR|nr:hypothetical protein GYMLUDRAFT_49611 [Collybiopsis luxurians FD-317 M1]
MLKSTLRLHDHTVEKEYSVVDYGVSEGEDDATLNKFICKPNWTTYHHLSTRRMGLDSG